jgi:hypothetical protein
MRHTAYIELPNGTCATVALFVEPRDEDTAAYDSHEVLGVQLQDGTEIHDPAGVELHVAGFGFLIEQAARREVDEIDPFEVWREYLADEREYDDELRGARE